MTTRKLYSVFFTIVLVVSVAACSNPESSIQYKSLKTEVDSLSEQIATLSAETDKRQGDKETLRKLNSQLLELFRTFTGKVADPSRRQAIVSTLGTDACARHATAIQEVVAESDTPLGSPEFWVAVSKKISPSDYALGFDGERAAIPTNDGTMEISEPMLAYAEDLRNSRCAYDAETKYIEQCEKVDAKVLNKNPAEFIGKCITGFARIIQFDTRTGPCTFHAYIDGSSVRVQFGQTLDPETQKDFDDCVFTKELVEGDVIRFWAYGVGAYTYATAIGGSATVPAFKLFMKQDRL
jgi:hypothetical protein